MEFDNERHEAELAERYAQLARLDAFDRFVDMALDGTITMDEAIQAYREEYVEAEA